MYKKSTTSNPSNDADKNKSYKIRLISQHLITIVTRNSFPQLKTRYKRGIDRIHCYIQKCTQQRYYQCPNEQQNELQVSSKRMQDKTNEAPGPQTTTQPTSQTLFQFNTPCKSNPFPPTKVIHPPLIIVYQPILPPLPSQTNSISAQFELEGKGNNELSAAKITKDYQKFNSPMALSFFWVKTEQKRLPKKDWQKKNKIMPSNTLSKITFLSKLTNCKR